MILIRPFLTGALYDRSKLVYGYSNEADKVHECYNCLKSLLNKVPECPRARVPKCLSALSAQVPECLKCPSVQVPECPKCPSAQVPTECHSALRAPECPPNAQVPSKCPSAL